VNSRRNSATNRLIKIVTFGLVSVLAIYLTTTLVAAIAGFILMPIHGLQSYLAHSTNSLPHFFRDRDALVRELQDLRSQIPTTGNHTVTITQLQAENNELRALLGAEQHERIAAGVLARPGDLPYDTMVLDQGSDDGVVVGAPVYAARDRIIGVVSAVRAHNATVTLVTSPGYRSTVYIYGPDIYTTAVGQGGGVLEVGVPQGVQLEIGDPVVLPALASGIYGEIVSIDSVPTQPEQYAYVTAEVPTSALRVVTVGRESVTVADFDEAQQIVSDVRTTLVVPVPEVILVSTSSTSTAEEIAE